MKLTRLRLHGFKSFVDAADIAIQPGVTGIVGPNGCGKSNLVEALRFVMGESSYKAMRGGGMEDVIFSGSGNRPVPQHGGGDAGRRARRGDAARTRDARDRAPHRARGRIDLPHQRPRGARPRRADPLRRRRDRRAFLRARPAGPDRRADRREAGCSGAASWRTRPASPACMRAATRRSRSCRAAEQNLERLARRDGARSSGRLEGLQRQARQAIRYRKISGEIRKAEAMLSALHWETAVARLAEAEAELAEADSALRRSVRPRRRRPRRTRPSRGRRLPACARRRLPRRRRCERLQARRGGARPRGSAAQGAAAGADRRAAPRRRPT